MKIERDNVHSVPNTMPAQPITLNTMIIIVVDKKQAQSLVSTEPTAKDASFTHCLLNVLIFSSNSLVFPNTVPEPLLLLGTLFLEVRIYAL